MKYPIKIIYIPNNHYQDFYKFSDHETRSFSLITYHSKTELDVEDDRVKARSCYKIIMQTPSFIIEGGDSIKNLNLLTAMVSKSLSLTKLYFKSMIFTKDHKSILANVAKSESLQILYIDFDNMIPGTEAASSELANSKSLIEMYIGFRCTAWHTTLSYYAIIRPFLKIPSLKKLVFQLSSKQECEEFADENNDTICEMINEHFKNCIDENHSKIINENFYPSFIALHYNEEMPLAVKIIGNIAKLYTELPSIDVEYSHWK